MLVYVFVRHTFQSLDMPTQWYVTSFEMFYGYKRKYRLDKVEFVVRVWIKARILSTKQEKVNDF